ncbi:hypothetical protein [Tenacibaculum xiamenense]|uniref:hypothetical protein n=1 Tax=Tenacibaculum xiamenense TaxID=1261553 RepID=UPI00389562CF
MNIQIRVKQLGKRKPIIENKTLDIPKLNSGSTLKIFLERVVEQQVNTFNSRIDNPEVLNFLLPNQLDTMVSEGKVDFKESYNSEKAKVNEAQEVALLAFKDGIYKVFLDDDELENLDDTLEFTEKNTFTFIRLTFLAGGYY